MVLHDCGEYTPVTTDQNSFQFVMSDGVVNCVDVVPAVPALVTACAAGCIVVLSCARWLTVFEPDCALLWVTAAACIGPAESLVVRGGSANGVSCEALAEAAAYAYIAAASCAHISM